MTDRNSEKTPSDVYSIVWPWRDAGTEQEEPDNRLRAVIEGSSAVAVALLFLLLFKKPVAGFIVLTIGGTVIITGLFIPCAYRGIKKAVMAFARVVGIALAWLLLVPFFYLCFPIGRLIFKLLGKNPLSRGFLPKSQTYWTSRPPAADPASYRKQF